MSEYQYYEFCAIDRPLTREQMEEVRAYSTRAQITPTSFTNEYHFGDFKGDPLQFVRRYYDLHVHFADWGTRRWLFRVPVATTDVERVEAYAAGNSVDMRRSGEHYLIDISVSPEEPDDYDAGRDVTSWAGDLAQLRKDVMGGDLRVLYLGWLLAVLWEEVEDEKQEPPVPAGLKRLSGPLRSFVEAFDLDEDLLAAAVEASGELAESSDVGLAKWIEGLPAGLKDQMLVDLCAGSRPALADELRAQYRKAMAGAAPMPGSRRTVGQLWARAAELEEVRKAKARVATEQKRQEKQREREAHLRRVAQEAQKHWAEVESLVQMKQAAGYEQAVTMLKDLRDAAGLVGLMAEFEDRLGRLMEAHRAKSSFVKRVREAGMG